MAFTINDIKKSKVAHLNANTEIGEVSNSTTLKRELVQKLHKFKKPAISSNALTKHAIRVLDLKGYHVWRQNNGGGV